MQQTSPHNPLTSKDNSVVKHLRSLADPKHRKKENAFLIEGVKMVEEALRDNLGVTMVIASLSLVQHHGKGVLKLAKSSGIDILWISDKLMDIVSESKTPQPVMALVTMREYSEDALLAQEADLIIVLHQLQDPGNLGTIIRTAEAAGASGIAISSGTVDPYNSKAVRASMGSVLRMPIALIADVSAFIKVCKQRGFQTAATVLTGQQTHFEIDLTKPTAIILGQEGAGLPQAIVADIDLSIRIPMAQTTDSLNVATAAAVIMYEAMRQRMKSS